jgi:hypothetical protein
MLDRLRARLTYANVTSTLALCVALGGGTAYAVDEWNGSNIQDESLTGADVRGSFPDAQNPNGVNGSLTSEDIGDRTIFPVDIAANSLGPDEIAAVGSGDIVANAINGDKVANDSLDGFDVHDLSGSDVVDGSLSGADIGDGSIGPEKLGAGALGYSQIEERTRSDRVGRGDRLALRANCRSGWRGIAGGFQHSQNRHPDDFALNSTFRYGNSWYVSGRHVGGPGAADIVVEVSVVCVR